MGMIQLSLANVLLLNVGTEVTNILYSEIEPWSLIVDALGVSDNQTGNLCSGWRKYQSIFNVSFGHTLTYSACKE